MRSVFESGKKVQRTVLSVVGLAVLVTGNALAGTAHDSIAASANVTNNCIITAGALAFGPYDPVSANATTDLTGTATLNVTCTNGATANITLDQGQHPFTGSSDATPLRQLQKDSSNNLRYYLYQDTGTTVWGNTITPTDTSKGYTGTGSSTNVTVYGTVTSGQISVHFGAYADTVVALITF